jgi:glutamyl-tRNA synthetase
VGVPSERSRIRSSICEAFREAARAEGRSTLFRSPWRDADPDQRPDAPFVVRLRAPREGETVIEDRVQGRVTTRNDQLDDMILLRSDGTPTYMLAVVVDDHDMGVTHVIRGDDHLANAARQAQIYRAMGWAEPVWAHIPLIHGADGKKLSKRHGALGVADYAAMGYPAPALRNYLTRLGWAHGDAEFFTDAQALDWFDLDGIGRAPARLDLKKLENLSGQHLSAMEDSEIVAAARDFATRDGRPVPDADRLAAAVPVVKEASKTLGQLLDRARFALIGRPVEPDAAAAKALDTVSRGILAELTPHLQTASWTRDALEGAVGRVAEARGLGLGKLAAPLRAVLAGRTATPSVFDMMLVLGRAETLARVADGAAAPGEDAT